MNLRQERLLSRRSQLGRERFKCWNAWCSWHRQRHERGRYRCVALSLFTDPAVHHVRVQAMRQGHTTDAGPRLGTQGKYLCLELLAVFTPAWAVLIQRLFHRLHDPPSWGRCPLHAGSSRWDRRALTMDSLSESGSTDPMLDHALNITAPCFRSMVRQCCPESCSFDQTRTGRFRSGLSGPG